MTPDLFRPRLPLDPFAAVDHDIPWSIPQNLPHSHPQLILILGEPPIHDLIPLLTSAHLSRSLILIATDNPPLIPANTRGPALRILRLLHPLAVHNAGALRLVGLFELAQRVAHLWPRDSSPHTMQLAQASPNGDFSIVEPVSYGQNAATTSVLRRYPSPASSTSESVSSTKWRSDQSTSQHKKIQRTKSVLDDKQNYKPFDAIINFLPHGIPDKALLKHAILVTTLSVQFLAPPTTTSPPHSESFSDLPLSSMSSPSHSYSSASQSITFPSSGSTPNTSPCPSTPSLRLSKDKDSSTPPTSTSKAKKRLSLLFYTAPLSSLPRSENRPLTDMSKLNDTEGLRKAKNAHLVHVLPMGWSSSDSGSEPDKAGESRASSSRLGGPSRQLPHPSGGYFETPNGIGGKTGKPKLVQSIEQFLLSFAYPLGSIVSSNSGSDSGSAHSVTSTSLKSLPSSSSASNLNNKKRKSARFSSSTSVINQEPINPTATANSRHNSASSFKGIPKAYEHAPLRASTLPSMSNLTFSSSNINTPIKPAPYLLAPGVFGRCILGSGRRDVDEDYEEDTRDDDAYMDPETTTSLTIGEIVLLGALDFDHTSPSAGPGNGRAWIGNVGDVVMVGERGLDPDSRRSGKVAIGKAKGRQVVINSLPTPPQSSSSNNSAESVDEEPLEEGMVPAPLSLLAYSSSVSDIGNLDHARTPPGARNGKKVGFIDEGVEGASVNCPSSPTTKSTSQSATTELTTIHNNIPRTKSKLSKRKSSSSSLSTATPTPDVPTSQVLNSKQPSAVQVPPLVIHRNRARSPRGSEDSYDLGLGHGVPVPSTIVSKKPGTRSASGSSGMGVIPPSGYGTGEMRSLFETGRKETERKGFMGVLRKMGLLKGGSQGV